jgi:ribonuclease VapC
MIVDSSVLIALLLLEPEAASFARAIAQSEDGKVPMTCYVESSLVILSRTGEQGFHNLDLLIMESHLAVVPFTISQARIARNAFRRYGKGRHPAGLNFGDCMAYALARESGEELLFKGTDFGLTDVAIAAY